MKLLEAGEEQNPVAFVGDFEDDAVQAVERTEKGTDTVVGSAYHAFLEHFDFARLDGVQGEAALQSLALQALEEMRAQGLLSEEYLSALQAEKLAEILRGEVFYRLRYTRLYKERRFMVALPAKEVLSVLGKEAEGGCPACDEDMLIQGAMDVLAVGEGCAEIVDYKYSHKGEDALRKTYSVQMRLYRMAVAKILGLPVESVRCTLVNIARGYEVEM
jgi:ATP-dependent helicase/nuclease subunit A